MADKPSPELLEAERNLLLETLRDIRDEIDDLLWDFDDAQDDLDAALGDDETESERDDG